MQLPKFPRRRYTPRPTELHPLDRLSRHLGGPRLWIKRDDQLGLAGGGNKTRKLEFLVADALEHGADTLITTGAVQSNHCRLTLAAAVGCDAEDDVLTCMRDAGESCSRGIIANCARGSLAACSEAKATPSSITPIVVGSPLPA